MTAMCALLKIIISFDNWVIDLIQIFSFVILNFNAHLLDHFVSHYHHTVEERFHYYYIIY